MKMDDLFKFVIVIGAVGIIIALVITVMGRMEVNVRDSLSLNNASVSGLLDDTSCVVFPTYNYTPCAISEVYNASTQPVNSSCYTLCSAGDYCGINVSTDLTGSTCNLSATSTTINVSFAADTDSDASTSLKYAGLAINELPTNWISIIVTVAALGIILGLIVVAFASFRGSNR